MSDESYANEPDDIREITGIVKWFNAVKGFGFVTVADSSNDAFLHLSILKESGYETLSPGATVRCEVADRIKGLQVTRIIDVDESTAEAIEPSAEGSGEFESLEATGDFVDATVKWFNSDKGYGFVCRTDSERDVFIHMVTLRRSGLKELEPGQTVKVRIAEGPKGPQATEIELQ
ncbi:MAG: CspA family cold shock protein [Alphaproteobacteria bacterium]|nr:CspA family cold shock protein [Alphaproteobacteria bacterium]